MMPTKYITLPFVTNKADNKPLQIVEHLPETMEDIHIKRPLSMYGRYFTTVGIITGEATRIDAFAVKHMI